MSEKVTESQFRAYSTFDMMSSLVKGDYKEPKVDEKAKETKLAAKKTDKKPLSDADYTKKIFMISIAQHNISYALAKTLTSNRNEAVMQDRNIGIKAGNAVLTAISLPVLAVVTLVEGIARRIIGSVYSCLFMAKPPAPSIDTKKKTAETRAADAKTEKKDPKKEKKSLLERHTTWVKDNMAFAERQQAGLSVAILAIYDICSTLTANFNIFHSTDSISQSMSARSVPFIVSPKVALLTPGISAIAVACFDKIGNEVVDGNFIPQTNFYENGHQISIKEKGDHIESPRSNPLFGFYRSMTPDKVFHSYSTEGRLINNFNVVQEIHLKVEVEAKAEVYAKNKDGLYFKRPCAATIALYDARGLDKGSHLYKNALIAKRDENNILAHPILKQAYEVVDLAHAEANTYSGIRAPDGLMAGIAHLNSLSNQLVSPDYKDEQEQITSNIKASITTLQEEIEKSKKETFND